jgi:hypothetical protein
MTNENQTVQKSVEKASHGLEKAAESLSEALIAIMDRLVGKKSDIRLSFEDLTVETGPIKAKLNGAIVLDIVYASDAEQNP